MDAYGPWWTVYLDFGSRGSWVQIPPSRQTSPQGVKSSFRHRHDRLDEPRFAAEPNAALTTRAMLSWSRGHSARIVGAVVTGECPETPRYA